MIIGNWIMQIFRYLKCFDFIDNTKPSHPSPEFIWFKAEFVVQFSLWCSSNRTSNCKNNIVLNSFNFVAKAFIVGWGLTNDLYIVIRECLGSLCLSFSINPIPLWAFDIFSLICWRKFSFSSRYIPKYLWQLVCATGAWLKLLWDGLFS